MKAAHIGLSSVVAGLLAVACSAVPKGSITLVTGDETDVFTRAPAPVALVTDLRATDGSRSELRRSALPVATVDLGERPAAEDGAIALRGLDAAGAAVVRGEMPLVRWGALEHTPLELFVQRTGELARMPRGPGAFDPAVATALAGRWVFAANGTTAMLYDLLTLRANAATTSLPRVARSVATYDTAVVLVDEGGATTFDLATGTSATLEASDDGSFAEIAGGARTMAPDGTQMLVGATRTSGGATRRVLVIDPNGRASFAALGTPRQGACAAYVAGRGLVVYGGDGKAPGAELLAPGAAVASPLPLAPDGVTGCAAAALDGGRVLVAGGRTGPGDDGDARPPRVLDLACAADCALEPWPGRLALVHAEAEALGADAALVVGDDATGATHAFRASASALVEIPLKVPRRGARLVATTTGAFVVVGGGPGIEQYLD